jgi:hypothetical protein
VLNRFGPAEARYVRAGYVLISLLFAGCSSSTTAPSTTSTLSTFVMTWPTLAFPLTGLGAQALTPVVITLVNTGGGPVPVASVTDNDTGEFPWTTTCTVGGSLAAGSSCAVTAQFTPAAIGARTATLTISANASTQTFELTGSGVATLNPRVDVSPGVAPPSSVFTLSVTGLTAGGQATLLTSYTPAQGNPPLAFDSTVWAADANGALTIASTPDAPGVYENWLVDASSGRSTNHVTHTVQ